MRKSDKEYYAKKLAKTKDGYYSVYYIPEEHYIGVSNQVKKRMWNHSSKGLITEGWEIIARFERLVDAHWFEVLFHQRGYNGHNKFNHK